MTDWEREILDQVLKSTREENPVIQHMHGTRYVSRSNGRGRKPRKPRLVELANWHGTRWTGKVPWDELATEFLGDHNDGHRLKEEFEKLLNEGRF